jgi:transcriptional regulator with XRE-family HTH domain
MYPNDKDKLPADGETLSNYIKRLRQQLHFSQQELANRAGIHIQSLGKLERGTRQRLNQKTKTALANVFDIPIEYLEAVSCNDLQTRTPRLANKRLFGSDYLQIRPPSDSH